jgi:hypothetical protein
MKLFQVAMVTIRRAAEFAKTLQTLLEATWLRAYPVIAFEDLNDRGAPAGSVNSARPRPRLEALHRIARDPAMGSGTRKSGEGTAGPAAAAFRANVISVPRVYNGVRAIRGGWRRRNCAMDYDHAVLKAIFEQIESTVIEVGDRERRTKPMRDALREAAARAAETLTDADYFQKMVHVVFYSGMKAATVTHKLGAINRHFSSYSMVADYGPKDISNILADPNMLKNKRKIAACIYNAKGSLKSSKSTAPSLHTCAASRV